MNENTTAVEVWILVDENGDYVCCVNRDELKNKHDEDVGGLDDGLATRIVKVSLAVPTPKPVELSATVAEEPAAGELVAQ